MNRGVEPLLAVIMFGVLATACADKSAVAPSAVAPPTSSPGGFSALLHCEVMVTTATMTCAPAPAAATTGSRVGKGGIDRDYVTAGGPGTYVNLISNGTTASAGLLTTNVFVWNLLAQPMNTPDGTTVDTGGVKVFFSSGPTVTSETGSGTVTVTTADGTGTFTGSDQPFYRYSNGVILRSGGTTAPKTWTFAYDPGVLSFTFDCYVYTQTPNTGILGTIVTSLVFYVVNNGTPSITVYGAASTGDVFPIGTIVGSSTVLDNPFGIAVNNSGAIYVTNDSDNIDYSSIIVFPRGSAGDPAPVDTIIGLNTGLAEPCGIAIDGSDNLYVTNDIGSSVTIYPPGAHGNMAFTGRIQGNLTHLAIPRGIALDGLGDIYVAGADDTVTVYPSGVVTGTVNLPASQVIAGSKTHLSSPFGIAVDGAGNIYVTNGASFSVTIYGPGATGNTAPIDSIAGSNTGLEGPGGIALDAAGNIYVANDLGGPDHAGSITVYAPEPLGAGMLGNVAPTRTVAGTLTPPLNNTGLYIPYGIAF